MLMKTAVVDDMQSEALLLEGFLKEYSVKTGHDMDITFFSGGESFLEAFEKEDFDLIFMDIYMNGISGVEVSKKLWESGRKSIGSEKVSGSIGLLMEVLYVGISCSVDIWCTDEYSRRF